MHLTLSPAVADAPFRLQISAGEAVPHRAWRQARATALTALDRGEAVALLGAPGTGKTLLLRDLAQALRREGRSVRLVERGDALSPGLTSDVLLVDEADRMSADVLARLCGTGRPCVLAALADFAERAAELGCAVTPVTLEPLSPEEIARFVAARLSAAGRSRDLLEPDAVLALARHSAGLLRLVNALAGAAAFLAELEQAPRVSRRHVDEAAALRGAEAEAPGAETPPTAPALPAPGPAATATACAEVPPAEAPVVSHLPHPARRRRIALCAAAVGLGLVLAGGWAVSGWRPMPPRVPDGVICCANSGSSAAGRSAEPVEAQRPQPRPDSHGHDAEVPRDDTGSSAPGERLSVPQQAAEARPPPHAGTAPRAQPAVPSASVAYRGPVYNDTMQQGGQMSLVIRRQPSGAVTARFEAWAGLLGSGDLTGQLTEDGRLQASGQLMVGRNAFTCELSGIVAGDRLTGSARFVRSGTGRVAYSRFALGRF